MLTIDCFTPKKLMILAIWIVLAPSLWAQDTTTCSRVAQINYQEVLVDPSSTQKGEGLRFYLEKDPVAKNFLDIYQERSQSQWLNATIGTSSLGLMVAGLLTNEDEDESGLTMKKGLIFGGAALFAINFLIAYTIEKNNEIYLNKAVQEYNKRNLPRIYFAPFKNEPGKGRNPGSGSWGATLGINGDF